MRRTGLLLVIALLVGGCSDSHGDGRRIVASIYPLAFAAEQLTGPEWTVVDLTPPGTEAHDLELSFEDRAAIQDADLVLYLGDVAFQPQVERAVSQAKGLVVAASFTSLTGDPHFWLAPGLMRTLASEIRREGLSRVDPEYDEPLGSLFQRSSQLHHQYKVGLEQCRFRTIIVSHEVFGYLEGLYDLEQFGLSGMTPEAEPSATRIGQAQRLVDQGEAGAIFYEDNADARRVAESFAQDAGVPALPINTLESRPADGDYWSAIAENLSSLREGLQCR